MKRQDASYNGGWTRRPPQPPLSRMASYGRKPFFRSWPGPTGRRQEPMTSDYAYPTSRQNSGRRRPVGHGGPVGQPSDFYSSSYDDGQNAYPDYVQPYEYDDVRRMPWPSDRQSPYDDSRISSSEASDFSDHNGHPKFNSPTTTVSATSGDYMCSGTCTCVQSRFG